MQCTCAVYVAASASESVYTQGAVVKRKCLVDAGSAVALQHCRMFRRVVCLLPKQAVHALAQTSSPVLQGLCLPVEPPCVKLMRFGDRHALLPVVLQTVRCNAVCVSPSHSIHAPCAPAQCAKLWAQSFASAAHPATPDYFTVLGV